MARVKRGVQVRRRHKKVIQQSKGFYGRSKNCYRIAIRRLEKSLQYAYRDRRTKKRDFRALWIQRINAAVREVGMIYSQFMRGLDLANIKLNRKILSDLAITQSEVFKELVNKSKTALADQ